MHVKTLFTLVANTHILANERGVYVVDAGMPLQARRVVNAIRKLGRAPNEVRLILITHGHIDHAGSAVALKRLTGAPIAMHRGDVRLTTTPSLKIPPGRNSATDVVARLMRAFGFIAPLETFTPDILLDDAQSLREFGLSARVIHTPGHTAGSASFLLDDGTIFLGDSVLRLLRVSFPLFWEDAAAAYASAQKIFSLKPRVCYSGHGEPFSFDELDKFIQRVAK